MSVFILSLNKKPIDEKAGVYETDEVVIPDTELPSTWSLIIDVSTTDAEDPTKSLEAEMLRFDPDWDEWIPSGGFGTIFGPPGGGNELVSPTHLTAQSVQYRPGTDTVTRNPRTIVFDLMNGKRVKVRLVMPTFIDCSISIESTSDARALKTALVQDRDKLGNPLVGADGKPSRSPDDGGRLEIHHSIGITDVTTATADAAILATSASHSIAAGSAASLVGAANGNAATDHTIDYVTGGTNHGFTERVLSKYSDTPNAAGIAFGASVHNSAGTTGTSRCTRNGSLNNGISFTIIEMTGVETSFSGHTAKGGSLSGSATVNITVSDGSRVCAAAEDYNGGPLAFTAGTGETLDLATPNTVNVICAEWHSTSDTTAGTYTSDAGGSSTRKYRIAALEMVVAAASGQPYAKRLGGVKFASASGNGVW